MKKRWLLAPATLAGMLLLGSCSSGHTNSEEDYLIVIGEHEQQAPEAGYRLHLAFSGPVSMQEKFQAWADSVQRTNPTMVKTSDNIYFNFLPEQLGRQRISKDMFQANMSFNLIVEDTAAYNKLVQDALRKDLPFNITVSGSHMAPEKRLNLQKQLMDKALENAKTKIGFLSGDASRKYEIVSVEELDSNVPYGPEYYDMNRKVVSRLKVKARLL